MSERGENVCGRFFASSFLFRWRIRFESSIFVIENKLLNQP